MTTTSPRPEGSALDSLAIDPGTFRSVLGHFPTGVVLITGIGSDGSPVGMVVGTFTSVSLNPPLVAFLPDKGSSTFPKLRESSTFVVNVLGAGQEQLCRTFGSKSVTEKWAGVSWRPAPGGAPILDEAVSWIECEPHDILDAGDHYIVVGAVRALEVGNPDLPLLFFQGGYGRFAPMSLIAPPDADLITQLRYADAAREEMEAFARETGFECSAQAVVADELVLVASSGSPDGSTVPSRVGARIPHVPPYGALFVAYAADPVRESWLARRPVAAETDRATYEAMLDWVCQHGVAVGPGHAATTEAFDELIAQPAASPGELQRIRSVVERLDPHPGVAPLNVDDEYDVRHLGAPVFDEHGGVALVLMASGLPERIAGAALLDLRARLCAAAELVTQRIGGRVAG
jgi:flavin reductase (DIM6/NTAB) family NADH-FMN oxidoreductase RutF/DNA-binding IclR family transcriptional regulator